MEKLTLRCGRYIPRGDGDTAARVKAMEAYLAGLSEELEYLLGEIDRTMDALDASDGAEASL